MPAFTDHLGQTVQVAIVAVTALCALSAILASASSYDSRNRPSRSTDIDHAGRPRISGVHGGSGLSLRKTVIRLIADALLVIYHFVATASAGLGMISRGWKYLMSSLSETHSSLRTHSHDKRQPPRLP